MTVSLGNGVDIGNIVTAETNPVTGRIEISLDGRNPEFKDKLLRLAAKADMGNSLIRPPLVVPPAWEADTAYVVRNVVANAGGWYICTTAGTSASSGGPTTVTSSQPVADGTAAWVFIGGAMASASDPAAPTVAYTASTPSGLTSFYQPIANPSVFRKLGAKTYTYATSYWGVETFFRKASTGYNMGARIEFMTDAPKFAIAFTNGPGPVRVFIDDQLYNINGLNGFSAGTPTYAVLDFGTVRKSRKVTVQGSSYNFGGVRVDPLSQVWKSPTDDDLRAVIISDSIFTDSAQSSLQCGECTGNILAKLLGWNDVWNFCRGGTGYVNPGASSDYTFSERVPEGITLNPDIWIFAGTTNDPPSTAVSGKTVADVTVNALKAWQQIRASGSRSPIIVFGVWPINNAANITLIESALQSAVTQFNDPMTFYIPLQGDSVLPILTGAWNNAALSSSVNNTLYLSADSLHPTDLGMRYLAERLANKIKTLVYPNL